MTHRERFRMVLRGELPDRVSMVCRLDIWHRARRHYGDMPDEAAGDSLEQLQLRLGMGLSARGGKVFRVECLPPVRHTQRREGPAVIEEWTTDKGCLRRVSRYEGDAEACGIRPSIVEYPIRSLDDYAVYEEIARHTAYVPDYEGYRDYDRAIGVNGLPMVILGPIPIQEILLGWTGYETGYDHLYNSPDVFLRAVETANEKHREMWRVVEESPCELVLYGAHFDSGLTPPPIFRKHFLPVIQAFNRRMHRAGKKVAFHADADIRLLMDLILEAEYDIMDCLAVSPLVNCDFQHIRQRCNDRIVLWGGIPSTMLEPPYTLPELEEHLRMLFRAAAPGRNFIVGFSDQAMPGSGYHHIRKVAEFVSRHAECPLREAAGY